MKNTNLSNADSISKALSLPREPQGLHNRSVCSQTIHFKDTGSLHRTQLPRRGCPSKASGNISQVVIWNGMTGLYASHK